MNGTPDSWILSEDYAGLRAQAVGLAEALGLSPDVRALAPRPPWKWFPAALWPNPLAAVREALHGAPPGIVIGAGGMAGAVLARLRRPGCAVIQVQNPRMKLGRFDLVVANTHDEISGPNVISIRTAIHRVTPARLAAEAELWRARFERFRRPLVAVLIGGSNGRYTLDADVGGKLARQLADMARRDNVGVVVTPSRRTDPAVTRALAEALAPFGGWVWTYGDGENPYFGMLALADMIVVTQDSVSMISEAAATHAPVLFAPLPGKSRRQQIFLDLMVQAGRVRPFEGRFVSWQAAPLDDTPAAAAEVRRRLGF